MDIKAIYEEPPPRPTAEYVSATAKKISAKRNGERGRFSIPSIRPPMKQEIGSCLNNIPKQVLKQAYFLRLDVTQLKG